MNDGRGDGSLVVCGRLGDGDGDLDVEWKAARRGGVTDRTADFSGAVISFTNVVRSFNESLIVSNSDVDDVSTAAASATQADSITALRVLMSRCSTDCFIAGRNPFISAAQTCFSSSIPAFFVKFKIAAI